MFRTSHNVACSYVEMQTLHPVIAKDLEASPMPKPAVGEKSKG